ncbi:hypothetical protein EVAR_69845_1 [Eumeta japonica]|uniref:Uncharacterized protein n=1 Tax=Eumeta variegata TaxID=151549 RepID=A0A4C1SFL2_EUMVA|nr:hypothetical protein EVAR_69845_1 [Eumeta japonica]
MTTYEAHVIRYMYTRKRQVVAERSKVSRTDRIIPLQPYLLPGRWDPVKNWTDFSGIPSAVLNLWFTHIYVLFTKWPPATLIGVSHSCDTAPKKIIPSGKQVQSALCSSSEDAHRHRTSHSAGRGGRGPLKPGVGRPRVTPPPRGTEVRTRAHHAGLTLDRCWSIMAMVDMVDAGNYSFSSHRHQWEDGGRGRRLNMPSAAQSLRVSALGSARGNSRGAFRRWARRAEKGTANY